MKSSQGDETPSVRFKSLPLTVLKRSSIRMIDRFLAQEKSKGSKEEISLGTEFGTYSDADLDVKVLLALAQFNDSVTRTMCIPDYFVDLKDIDRVNFHHTNGSQKVRAGILITKLDTETPFLHIPDNVHSYLDECERRGKRFVIFNTGLYWDYSKEGHANVTIFDLKRKIIERYEPEGSKGIVVGLKEVLLKEFPGWTYVGPDKMERGVQDFADSFSGMCVTFSLYYTLLKLSNPDESALSIYDYIHKRKDNGYLRDDILKLNKFASNVLRSFERGSLSKVRTRLNKRLNKRLNRSSLGSPSSQGKRRPPRRRRS